MNKYFVLAYIFLASHYTFCQSLNGYIKNQAGETISIATIYITETDKPDHIKEFLIVRNQPFNLALKKDYKNILIKIRALGYIDTVHTIENVEKNRSYDFNFLLSKSDNLALKEVVVVAKRNPIQTNGDTTTYQVSAFKNGSERKIEDIIKKLPGIEVNEKSGEIKYKGKPIETVQLDGDNLFGFNYSIGTKNINVDMVEQVQAIENYTENPLLKGIEAGEKVVLNLKLKKGKHDFSGNVDAGVGLFDKKKSANLLNTTILGVATKYKSFAVLSYNNVGINSSPFNYFGTTRSMEKSKEQEIYAKKVIPDASFENFLNEDRTNINKQLFNNFNTTYQIGKTTRIKANAYYLADMVTSNRLSESNYHLANITLNTSDAVEMSKKVRLYRGDLDVKIHTNKHSLLEYELKTSQDNVRLPIKTTANKERVFLSDLTTASFLLKQKILFTNKLSPQKVFQLSILNTYNASPQVYQIRNLNSYEATQKSEFKKRYTDGKASILGTKNSMKYGFHLGFTYNDNPIFSSLNLNDSLTNNTYNEVRYSQKSFYSGATSILNVKNWRISTGYALTYLSQFLKNTVKDTSTQANNLVFEPYFNIQLKTSKFSSISLKANYTQKPNGEEHFFYENILVSNRMSVKNIPDFRLQTFKNAIILYHYSDLYNQIQLNANFNYQQNSGMFFSDFSISPFLTQVQYFFFPQKNTNKNAEIDVSKFVSSLASNLRISASYSSNQYLNTVNKSNLRTNKSTFFTSDFSYRTVFSSILNIENKFQYQKNVSRSEEHALFDNSSLLNTFKIIGNFSEKINAVFSTDYYLPNKNASKNYYLFVDFSVRYKPQKKNWELNFHGKNLTNETAFSQIQTSDMAISIYQTNILPRYFLIGLSFRL